jgi:hypothetical protein
LLAKESSCKSKAASFEKQTSFKQIKTTKISNSYLAYKNKK